MIPYSPIDFVFLFGITASYYYGFIYGLVIFFLGTLNRIILSSFQFRHLSKGIRHIPLFYLSFIVGKGIIFKNYGFFNIALILLIFNYILKFLLKIAKNDLEIEKTHFHVVNFFLSILGFYLVSIIYEYIPFLK
ncbi:MAG: hypothetical protein QXR96_01670 [Candidatus Woesearchaeota archaeon]